MAGYPQWLPLGLVVLALPLAWGAWESRSSDAVRAVVDRGTRQEAFVVSKFTRTSSGSKNSSPTRSHWIRLRRNGEAFDRRVGQDAYDAAVEGRPIPWYDDPAVPGGFSALEIEILTDGQVVGYLLGLVGCLFIPRFWRKALPGDAVVSPAHGYLDDVSPVPDRDALAPVWQDQVRARRRLAVRVLGGSVLVSVLLAGVFRWLGTPGAAWIAIGQGGFAVLVGAWILGRTARRDRTLWREGRVCRGRVLSALATSAWTRLTVQVEAPRSTVEAVRWVAGSREPAPGSPIPVLVIDGDPVRVAPVPSEARP